MKNLLTIILIVLFAIILYFFYIKKPKSFFEFPRPTGKYGIGTTERHLIDKHRQEPNNLSAKREVMIYFYYPANANKNSLVPPKAKDLQELKSSLKRKGYTDKALNELSDIYFHSIENAPIVKGNQFPVLLFSHGYLGTSATSYAHIFEDLASHGYIVVSIAHTYFGSKVEFPDGHSISPNPEKYAQETMPTSEEQDLWVQDAQFILDELQKINQNKNDQFYNYFDMNNIGAFGHSFGGLTAFYLCIKDPRVKAGIDLDQTPYLDNGIFVSGMKKPFMFIMTECFNKSDEELAKSYQCDVKAIRESRNKNPKAFDLMDKNNAEIINSKSKNLSYKVIPNLLHNGFTDLLILKELPIYKNNKNIINLEAMTGSAEGFDATKLINSYIVGFFDTYLKRK